MANEKLSTDPDVRGKTFKYIAEELNLSKDQIAEARIAGVTNSAEFFDFLSISARINQADKFNIADLSANLVNEQRVVALRSDQVVVDMMPDEWGFGAQAPEQAEYKDGDLAPELTDGEVEELASFEVGPFASEEPIGITTCGNWPVRNQGKRGTCVSFATTAAYELYLCATEETRPNLSEQFLYWALKHNGIDPNPSRDGTWYRHAVTALNNFGICLESQWRYDPTPIQGNISHNPPPSGAKHAALTYKTFQPLATQFRGRTGKAQTLLNALKAHNGVAIALPVFDSPDRSTHNWITRIAQLYGYVQNPRPNWIANGGHAVCCVGFVPDDLEPLGGHFIIRNSWGTNWGRSLPDPAYAGSEPGYGQVSATYVDKYLWEICVF